MKIKNRKAKEINSIKATLTNKEIQIDQQQISKTVLTEFGEINTTTEDSSSVNTRLKTNFIKQKL